MPEHVDSKIVDESSMIIPSSPVEEEEEEEFLEVEDLLPIEEANIESIATTPTTTIIDEPNDIVSANNNQQEEQVQPEEQLPIEGETNYAGETSIVVTTSVDKEEETPTTRIVEQIEQAEVASTTPSTTTNNTTENEQDVVAQVSSLLHDPSSPNSLLDELDHIFDTTPSLPQHSFTITQSCSSSSLTIPLRDYSLTHFKDTNFQRRKRKDHPSPTLYEQQIKQHTKRTKTNTIYSNIPINFVSNSAFLLSNVIESSIPYNNTTVCYDDHSTNQCPWLGLLSGTVGNRGELVLEESNALLGKLQKLTLHQNSSPSTTTSSITSSSTTVHNNSSRYSLLTDPYCTIMRVGGKIYKEIYDDHSSCTFNALITCENDNKFMILQLQTNVLNDNIFAVYARFGQVGKAGQTYSRLFDNVAHAKQFFVDSLLAITEGSTISTQCSVASRVCYEIPSISFF